MKIVLPVLLILTSVSVKSQKIFVQETEYNLESILKKAFVENKDTVTELATKADYIIKIVIDTRGALERGTVKAVMVKANTGLIIYETKPEKVTSHYGVPTSTGMKHAINHIAEDKIKEISLMAENDYLKKF